MTDESFIDNELLISLVERKPVLWDKSMDLYKNRVATQAAWQEIMIDLNPDFQTKGEKARQVFAKLIIQRWTHIRDSYNRSCKKIEDQKRSGTGAKTVKTYVYNKQLRFLQKVIHPKSNVVTENDNIKSENQDSNSKAKETSETNETSESECIQLNDVLTTNPMPERTQKRPINNDVNVLDAKMMRFMNSYSNSESKANNRHLSFFNGILPSLDNLDEDEVLEFQIGVLELVKKIKNSRQNREDSVSKCQSHF